MKQLILGGVRSGKSRFAEQQAQASGMAVTYIATATAEDEEMLQRINEHRRRRPVSWSVVEEPRGLARTLQMYASENQCLLVDCLTLWLTNLLLADDETLFANECNALVSQLPDLAGHIILVSNETGMGVVPKGAITRRFCDESGRLHQRLARVCDQVILMVAGLPQVLKGDPL